MSEPAIRPFPTGSEMALQQANRVIMNAYIKLAAQTGRPDLEQVFCFHKLLETTLKATFEHFTKRLDEYERQAFEALILNPNYTFTRERAD